MQRDEFQNNPNSPSGPGSNDIQAMLAISQVEASTGTSRVLTLPGGRPLTVTIPAGAYEGQIIRLPMPADPSSRYPGISTLVLTITIQQVIGPSNAPQIGNFEQTWAANAYIQYPPATSQPSPTAYSSYSGIPPTAFAGIPAGQPEIYAPPPPPNQSMPGFPPLNPGGQVPPPEMKTKGMSKRKTTLLVVVILLLIASSVGISVAFAYKVSADHTASTATALSSHATGTAYAGTALAHNISTQDAATVQAIAQATTSARTANPDPYAPSGGTLAIYDPLHANSGSNWSEGTNQYGGACLFTGEAYHVSETNTKYFQYCNEGSNFSNFAFEVQMKISKGDCGGMVFDVEPSSGKLYFFRICQDGYYSLYRYLDSSSSHITTLAGSNSSAVHTGLNQTNVIAIVAHSSVIDLYINSQRVNSVRDSTFSSGEIGLCADPSYSNHPTDVAYNNAKVWTL